MSSHSLEDVLEKENFVDSSEHNSSDEDERALLKSSQPENFVDSEYDSSSDDGIKDLVKRCEQENFVEFDSSDEEINTEDSERVCATMNIKTGVSNVQNSIDPSIEILVAPADEDMGLVVTEAVENGMCIIDTPSGDMLIMPTGKACTLDINVNSYGDIIITRADQDGLDLVVVDNGDMVITNKSVDNNNDEDTSCLDMNGIRIVVTTSADLLISENMDSRFELSVLSECCFILSAFRGSAENFVDFDGEADFDGECTDNKTSVSESSGDFLHSGNVLFKVEENVKQIEFSFKMKRNICSKKCNKKCEEIALLFTDEEATSVKSLKGRTIVITKNNLLNRLKAQSNLGVTVTGYLMKGQIFCLKYFSSFTNISEFLLKSVLSEFHRGARQYIHGNTSTPQESVASVKFTSWMLVFSELYGQSAPDERTTILPSWLTKATLFRIYLQESTAPFVKKSNFYHLFKDKFGHLRTEKSLPHIRISKYSTHSVCPQCVALGTYQRSCRTQQELEYCKALKFRHKQCYGQARRKISELEQLAITYPEDHLFLALDGMDNRKSDLPKFQQNAKNFVNFQKLPTHITGAIVTSGFYPEKQKTFFYLNHNQYEQGQCQILEIRKNNIISLCDPIGKQTFCMTIIIRYSGCPCIHMCDQFTNPRCH